MVGPLRPETKFANLIGHNKCCSLHSNYSSIITEENGTNSSISYYVLITVEFAIIHLTIYLLFQDNEKPDSPGLSLVKLRSTGLSGNNGFFTPKSPILKSLNASNDRNDNSCKLENFLAPAFLKSDSSAVSRVIQLYFVQHNNSIQASLSWAYLIGNFFCTLWRCSFKIFLYDKRGVLFAGSRIVV